MDEETRFNLPDDAVFLILQILNVEELSSLCCVCHAWQAIYQGEEFWRSLYLRKRGNGAKLVQDLSYKQNYCIPLLVCHTTDALKLEKYHDQYDSSKVVCQEFNSDKYSDYSKCEQDLTKILDSSPAVFCESFGPHCRLLKSGPWTLNARQLAREKDVLVIFPVGNAGLRNSNICDGINLHEAFPNAIWTASTICSNFGELVDVVVSSSDGTSSSAIILAKFVSQLRALRPGLTAPQIRSLIIKTATRTEDTQAKFPNGGILNPEAAINAVKKELLLIHDEYSIQTYSG